MNKEITINHPHPPDTHSKAKRSPHFIKDLLHALNEALHTPQGCEISALRAMGKNVPCAHIRPRK